MKHVQIYGPFELGYNAEEFVRAELLQKQDEALSEEQIESISTIDTIVDKAFKKYLSKKKRRVIDRRFGLHGYREHAVNQVAAQLGMSEKIVNAHEVGALKNIRYLMKHDKVEDLLVGLA